MAAQVDEFRLAGETETVLVEGIDIDAIIDAHRQWKVKLRDAIEHGAQVDVATLSRDDCCALGKWIYGEGGRFAGRHRFDALCEKHKHFHQVAGRVGETINQRRYEEAEEELAPGTGFALASSEVVLELASAKRLGFD
jgi:methyl-accepting chemotaxis protein